jgi:hypothetical protein
MANSTAHAYSGTHSLALPLTGDGNGPSVAEQDQVDNLVPGVVITYYVWSPNAGTAAQGWLLDCNWNVVYGPQKRLAAGWNTLKLSVPAGFCGPSKGVGFQAYDTNRLKVTLYLGAVNWPVAATPVAAVLPLKPLWADLAVLLIVLPVALGGAGLFRRPRGDEA